MDTVYIILREKLLEFILGLPYYYWKTAHYSFNAGTLFPLHFKLNNIVIVTYLGNIGRVEI